MATKSTDKSIKFSKLKRFDTDPEIKAYLLKLLAKGITKVSFEVDKTSVRQADDKWFDFRQGDSSYPSGNELSLPLRTLSKDSITVMQIWVRIDRLLQILLYYVEHFDQDYQALDENGDWHVQAQEQWVIAHDGKHYLRNGTHRYVLDTMRNGITHFNARVLPEDAHYVENPRSNK